ncbi:MAG: gas vesicle protein GvpG [Thermoleophilia bacterium]|nr:gas vesicle protein GvpG [Thermoleophilia bacterium]
MGLFTALLTLPLAPVRGTVWIAERIAEQAELELEGPERIRRELLELEAAYDLGEVDDAEYEQLETELLRRLRAASGGEGGGPWP